MLKFATNQDKYKILILGDIQAHGIIKEPEQNMLGELVKRTQPDLVVFLGDMISGVGGYGWRKLRKMIYAMLNATVGTTIPFAIVSGNHESFTTLPYSRQIEIYRQYPNCLTPSRCDRACRKAYTLDLTSDDKKPLVRLLFFDCAGSKATSIGQVYKKTKPATLKYTQKLLFDPNCPPTVIFQHIIIPDVQRLLKTYDKDSKLGVRGSGPFRGFRVALAHPETGFLGECPSPAWDNALQFTDWTKSKKVVAAVFAHDHVNSFEDELDGVKIIQCPCAGLSCYGSGNTRGARVVTITRSGKVSSIPYYYNDFK
ncbi:metallophosphoesterase [Candidatus Saccharibacteria bacterium]|nr:metallophosphoesterase [Candidatus Saccharibacteria bacterium]